MCLYRLKITCININRFIVLNKLAIGFSLALHTLIYDTYILLHPSETSLLYHYLSYVR